VGDVLNVLLIESLYTHLIYTISCHGLWSGSYHGLWSVSYHILWSRSCHGLWSGSSEYQTSLVVQVNSVPQEGYCCTCTGL